MPLYSNTSSGLLILETHVYCHVGQGGDAPRSYFQGQRPDPKLDLEKQSNSDPRSQTHEENMNIVYEGNPLSQTFENLEQKFRDDIIKLAKEQNDTEDAENARHREVSRYLHFLLSYCGWLVISVFMRLEKCWLLV
jgi:hypothetical protein